MTSPTLSPDNRSIVFALSDYPGRTNIAFYEIATKQLTRINPTGQDCLGPIFSPDGKMLTFASGKTEDEDFNIFIMDADGSNLRQLTHTVNDKTLRDNGQPVVRINGQPSFSPDSRKVIFGRSGIRRQRSMGGEMISHWDIYEIDLVTGRERRLTNYKYYQMTRAYYLPDGQGFIFSASGPKGVDLPREMLPINGNEIFIQDEKKTYPYLVFEKKMYAVKPSIASDGAIVFVSVINELDGLNGPYLRDLFIYKEGGIRRLTTGQFVNIQAPFLSFDGSMVVFLGSKTREDETAIWLVNSDGTELTYVRPWYSEK